MGAVLPWSLSFTFYRVFRLAWTLVLVPSFWQPPTLTIEGDIGSVGEDRSEQRFRTPLPVVAERGYDVANCIVCDAYEVREEVRPGAAEVASEDERYLIDS